MTKSAKEANPPMMANNLILGSNNAQINNKIAPITPSKNLSVKPADNPSDKVISLIFLPATAFNTSPALRMGLKLPAKRPMVLTMKFFLSSQVWSIMKPQRNERIQTTKRCIKRAKSISQGFAVFIMPHIC